jgi:hypothetical protein
MNNDSYVAFLLLGIVLIVADGQVLYRSGQRYLVSAYGEGAASVGRLVTILFYLVMLGVLALMSAVDIPGNGSLPEVVSRIGILLLIMAVGHGTATWILAILRRRQENQRLNEKLARGFDDRGPTVSVNRSSSSAGGESDVHTTISAIESDRPIYTPSDQPYTAPTSPGVIGGSPQNN